MPKEKQSGKITHFFGKIKVAVVKVSDPLKIGDKIKVVGGETEFTQTISSMEVDGKKIKSAKKGMIIGLKLSKKAREDYKIYKL